MFDCFDEGLKFVFLFLTDVSETYKIDGDVILFKFFS